MNNITLTNQINIEDLIYEIRGKQVMLDSDLAKLYNCTNGTKEINQAVKRNIEKFPEDFYFMLTEQEYTNLKSQFVTSSLNSYGGRRNTPHVFTELGVAMLSSVLKTEIANKVSVNIIRAFVNMRKYISNNLLEHNYITNMVIKHEEDIKTLYSSLEKLKEKRKVNSIFFKGQIYDAYSLLLDIINKSKQEIIIIDNYADKKLLDILTKTKKQITLYTKNTSEELIKKYQTQYNNLTIIKKDNLHDRFIILDKKILYHSGASFKDLGKNCFAINEVEDKAILKELLTHLEK